VVDPAPASGSINFLAYPLLEMNGEIIKPETTFTFIGSAREALIL
jgi:hypothetical protein